MNSGRGTSAALDFQPGSQSWKSVRQGVWSDPPFIRSQARLWEGGPLAARLWEASPLFLCQNRERTGVPARAARVGWWMRPDQTTQH